MSENFSNDIDPATASQTESLINCTLRFLYNNDTHFDFKINNSPTKYTDLDRTKLKSVVVLNEDGTERIEPITIPKGKTVACRLRTMIKGGTVNKFLIIGIVNSTSQVLHYIYRDGTTEVIDTPDEFAKYGKLKLRADESG